jgi:excisionase family DNA binding protein
MDTPERITVPIDQFCKLAGIGRSLVYEMLGDGRLESITIGRRRLIITDSFRRLVEQQRAAGATSGTRCAPGRGRGRNSIPR